MTIPSTDKEKLEFTPGELWLYLMVITVAGLAGLIVSFIYF